MSSRDAPLIVVIDDDDPFLALMQDVLTGEGYRVVTDTVMDDPTRFITDARPALLILDLVMETAEAGLDILRAVRADSTHANIPVLLCTANHLFGRQRAHEVRALGAEIILKPFLLTDMLNAVAGLVRRPA